MKTEEDMHSKLMRISQEEFQGTIKPQALAFVHSALDYAVARRIEGRDITGQQLCEAVRDVAAREYGLMAREVLAAWGIDSTESIGRIVFALVKNKEMSKTEEDKPADFVGVFDFDEAFDPARILHAAREQRPRVWRRKS